MELKVTIIQSDLFWEDINKNLNSFSEKINSIQEKTDLIILPEMFATGFSMIPEKFSKYEKELIDWFSEYSSSKNVIITGSIITKDNNNFFNTLIWMLPDGTYKTYNKRHLFTFAGEDKHYSAGKDLLLTEINNIKIKPLICYDLRFPVWSRNKNNYDVLIYIANWPERRNDAWKTLLKARAIENQCFVIGVNRIGNDGNNIYHSGDSMVIDPKGKTISSINAHEEKTETLTLNIDELNAFRKKFPVGNDADSFEIF